jgi:hypothetical protein
VQPAEALRRRYRRQQDVVDDVPHEQRLHHLEAGRDERQREDHGGLPPVRPQPLDVGAHVLPSLALREERGPQNRDASRNGPAPGRRRVRQLLDRAGLSGPHVLDEVEALLPIVVHELLVPATGRAQVW